MKICPNCGNQLDDSAAFCTNCGNPFTDSTEPAGNTSGPSQGAPYGAAPTPDYNAPYNYGGYAPQYVPNYDHTAEFDPKDISENKVYSMLPYLMGVVGIIIALLASGESPYARFHIRQAVKFEVVTILMWIVALLTCWLFMIPIFAACIMTLVLLVIKIICFVQICSGRAVEPAIIRSLGFLK